MQLLRVGFLLVVPPALALSALFLVAVVVLEWRRPYDLTADDVEHEGLDPAAHHGRHLLPSAPVPLRRAPGRSAQAGP
ncbi:hypothetical protein [Brachybacterium squillarum]|uniref:hypothetical protein n=1 Tax=Brachybacterium squillarum TaxID=661979 RepID=UPI0011126FEA|nr:hypothetical protein [Brachybacterium squillarum]